MCNLPTDIEDCEDIARAVMSPYHFDRKGNLRAAVFRSAPGTDDVSVIRASFIDSDTCKAKAQTIAGDTPGKSYIGFSVLGAASIRSAGAGIVDSRSQYCGHASIRYGIIVPRNEPAESDLNRRVTELTRKLLKSCVFHRDSAPGSAQWTALPLSWPLCVG
jgi:hypothetical protein